MSDLYWLQPGWTSALCCSCGCNIWNAGGDPDHGLCPSCWDQSYQQEHQQPEPEHELPEPEVQP